MEKEKWYTIQITVNVTEKELGQILCVEKCGISARQLLLWKAKEEFKKLPVFDLSIERMLETSEVKLIETTDSNYN